MHQNSEKKKKCFVKLEPLKFFDGAENYMTNEPAYFLSIRFILNNPRFNNWFKGLKNRGLVTFAK